MTLIVLPAGVLVGAVAVEEREVEEDEVVAVGVIMEEAEEAEEEARVNSIRDLVMRSDRGADS